MLLGLCYIRGTKKEVKLNKKAMFIFFALLLSKQCDRQYLCSNQTKYIQS